MKTDGMAGVTPERLFSPDTATSDSINVTLFLNAFTYWFTIMPNYALYRRWRSVEPWNLDQFFQFNLIAWKGKALRLIVC